MTSITVSTSELPGAKAKLAIEIPPDLVEHAIEHAVEHMAEELKLPGFREGKVPTELAKQKLGREEVFEHAFNESVGGWYARALADAGISPIGSPSLNEAPAYTEGEPLRFELEVPVRPVAELPDYEGIEVGKKDPAPNDEAVEHELEVMRDRFSALGEVERAARQGDFVEIDFVGRIGGEAFPGGAGNDFVLELGSGQFIEGFEEQLAGKSAGDDVEVKVTFPADYQAEHLAGAEAVFEVKVKAVKEKKLPELNDEFASENLGYDTLDELRAEIAERIAEQAQQEVDREYRWAVVDAVAKQAKIDVPPGHIHSRAHELWEELAFSLAQQGIDPRAYLQAMGKGEHEFIEGAEDDAELTIRREATIAAVIAQQGIEVTEDDMVAEIAEAMNEGDEKAREKYDSIVDGGGKTRLERDIQGRRAIDHLVAKSKPIPFDQAEARDAIWTPEKDDAEGKQASEGLWTPGP